MPPEKIEVATSLFLAPQAMVKSASAVFGYLEWESHRRALANGPAWYVLYRGGLLAADAKKATRRAVALRHLGFVPVSPDGFSYRFEAGRDEVTNERHGSYRRPRLGDGLDDGSAGRQLLGSLRTLRVDLRFREDGVQTALTFDRKMAAGKTPAVDSAQRAVLKLGGWIDRDETQPDHPLFYVNLADTNTGDSDLAELKKLPGLHTLILDNSLVTDAGLAQLKGMTDLHALHLADTAISNAGLQHLHGLKALARIDLEETAVTDSGAEALRKAMPGLKTIIRRADHEVMQNRLKHSIAGLKGRGQTPVKSVKVTREQLAQLDGLDWVEHLDLSGSWTIDDRVIAPSKKRSVSER